MTQRICLFGLKRFVDLEKSKRRNYQAYRIPIQTRIRLGIKGRSK
jgi:hypothetical protein